MNMKKSSAFSLIELMLTITILMAASVGVYYLMHRAKANAAVEIEQRQMDTLIEGIQGHFMANPDFSGVDNEWLIDSRMQGLRVSNGELSSGFNTPMFVRSATTLEADDSFDVVYQGLNTEQCLKMIPALYSKSNNIFVGAGDNPTTSVQETAGSGTGRLRGEDVLLSACGQSVFAQNNGTVVFRIFSPRQTGTTILPPTDCLCEPTTENQTIGCPAGQVGSIRQTRNGTCTGGTPSCPDLAWGGWTTTSNTCVTPPTTPPPTPPVVVVPPACTPYTVNRTGACPAGQTGQIVFQDNYVCATPTSSPTLGTSTQLSNTCAPPPPVVTTCTPSTETRYQACPAGQGGQIIEERSSSCPTSTSTPVWGAWVETSRTCTATCITAGNCCTPGRQSRSVSNPCPAGSYGGPQTDTEEQVSTCASATATPVWTGSWYSIGPTGGTCTSCPAATNETQTRWVPNSSACPAGQTGSNTWEEEQVATRTVSYSCPAGTTTLPGASYGAWGAWSNTGALRNQVNTCAPISCTGDPTETQWVPRSAACPVGQTGSNTWEAEQVRTRVCSSGTWGAYGGWSDTGATRNAVNTCAPATCNGWMGTFGSDNEDDGNSHNAFAFNGVINQLFFSINCDSNGVGFSMDAASCSGTVGGTSFTGRYWIATSISGVPTVRPTVFEMLQSNGGISTAPYDCSADSWRCAGHNLFTLRSNSGTYLPGDYVDTWMQECSGDCDQFDYSHNASGASCPTGVLPSYPTLTAVTTMSVTSAAGTSSQNNFNLDRQGIATINVDGSPGPAGAVACAATIQHNGAFQSYAWHAGACGAYGDCEPSEVTFTFNGATFRRWGGQIAGRTGGFCRVTLVSQ